MSKKQSHRKPKAHVEKCSRHLQCSQHTPWSPHRSTHCSSGFHLSFLTSVPLTSGAPYFAAQGNPMRGMFSNIPGLYPLNTSPWYSPRPLAVTIKIISRYCQMVTGEQTNLPTPDPTPIPLPHLLILLHTPYTHTHIHTHTHTHYKLIATQLQFSSVQSLSCVRLFVTP